MFTSCVARGVIVYILHTSAYSAEIFYGRRCNHPQKATRSRLMPNAFRGWPRFKRIVWPDHACGCLARLLPTSNLLVFNCDNTLVFFNRFSGAWQQRRRLRFIMPAILADKTFNPFVPYSHPRGYFILLTLVNHLCLRADSIAVLTRPPAPVIGAENSLVLNLDR